MPGFGAGFVFASNPQNCRNKQRILDQGTLHFLRQAPVQKRSERHWQYRMASAIAKVRHTKCFSAFGTSLSTSTTTAATEPPCCSPSLPKESSVFTTSFPWNLLPAWGGQFLRTEKYKTKTSLRWQKNDLRDIFPHRAKVSDLSDARNPNHKSLAIANHNFEVASFSRRNRNDQSQFYRCFRSRSDFLELRLQSLAIRDSKSLRFGSLRKSH